jgi:hypothetical protein
LRGRGPIVARSFEGLFGILMGNKSLVILQGKVSLFGEGDRTICVHVNDVWLEFFHAGLLAERVLLCQTFSRKEGIVQSCVESFLSQDAQAFPPEALPRQAPQLGK